jgi:hypothetical protein
MLQWLSKRKGRGTADTASELDFLRGQEDFDAEEMASVHGASDEDESAAWSPEWPQVADPGATQPAIRFEETWISRPEIPQAADFAVRTAPGELILAAIVDQRSCVVTVRESALVGRCDPEQELFPEIDLTVDDAVSRRHARIYRSGGQFFIQDLQSTNGTCLNGEWVEPGRDEALKSGDILLLGEVSELQVLSVSFGADLTPEDRALGNLLGQVLGEPKHEQANWDTLPDRRRGEPLDLLDVALMKGVQAGLLEDDSEWGLPARPEWRLREFDGADLPSFAEPYR